MSKRHHNSCMAKLFTLVMLAMLLAPSALLAQTQQVKGTVLDENGEPVIGASVIIVGSKGQGTVTDLDGNYTVSVPKGAKVKVSYIGYKPQEVEAGQTIKLLPADTSLNEVVVVGYGSQKKAHLTGSIATVPMDEIQDLSSGGLASTLSGLVNGVSVSGGESRPGENATIKIRDTNSLGDVGVTSQEPLYVIDGYIYPNDVKTGNTSENLGATAFNNLDPSEVESISVLKDAAAAVYGARAANGVILVTTKKGKMGAPRISYSGTFGMTDEVARPKMLSSYEYGRLFNAIKTANNQKSGVALKTTDLFQNDELQRMRSLNYDLLDENWKTAFTMKHSANISGATERANYFAGISYFKQDGNLGKLDYSRWNYRAGVDVKVTKWLKANITVSGDNGKKNTPLVKVGGSSSEKDYNILLTRPRYIPEYVNGMPVAAYGVSNSQLATDQLYSFSTLRENGDYSRTVNSNLNVNGSVDVDFGSVWEPLKGLSARVSYAKSINTDKTNQYGTDYTVYSMKTRYGSGSHLYDDTGMYYEGVTLDDILLDSNYVPLSVSNGSPSFLSRNSTRTDNYQINFTLNYSRDFGQHHIGGLFSIEKSEAESEYLYGMVSDPYPFTTGQSNSAEGNTKVVTFTRSESGTLSYIGRLNYAFSNKYLLEFLMRADASTKFAPENMWGYFPSASAGWVISEEPWMRDVKWVDYLKLRGSFGLTGRDNTAAWQWMQVYAQDANRGPVFGEGTNNETDNRITINKTNSAVNRGVHWDKSYKANFGIDFNTLNSRLSVNIDAYYTWNREMLLNINNSTPTTIGSQTAALNVGEMNNYGIELGLTWKDKIGKDFKYRVGINTGYSDNKVHFMDFENEYLYRQIRPGHRSDVGIWGMECLGMFRTYQDIEEYFDKYGITSYMGMTKDKVRPGMLIYKDVRGAQQEDGTNAGPDGIVDVDNDQVQLSKRSSNPYGFTMNLGADYKGFSLTAQLSASWGAYSFVPSSALKTGQYGIEVTNMPSFWNVDNMYSYETVCDEAGNVLTAANRGAKYPNLAYANVNAVQSSFWRVSGTRIQLNRLTLAYTIPSEIVKKIGIQSCRVNVTGQNLISFCNPYPDNFISTMSSYGSYPTLRKWTVGINIGF